MKIILIFNATEIPCGEHRKFEPFIGYCFAVSRLDEILKHKRNVALKQIIIFFPQKHLVYRLMYSQYENENSNMGKANCRRTIEVCLVFNGLLLTGIQA